MAFILGSLVSAPSVTAVAGGTPFVFLEGEIEAIKDLIRTLEEKLENVQVPWDNVINKPYEVLYYEQRGPVTVPQSIREPILIELAVWKIVRNSDFKHDVCMVVFDTSVYGQVRQTSSGTFPSAQTGWYKSEDATFSTTGMHWKEIESISARTDFRTDGTIIDVKASTTPFFTICSQYNFLAFGTTNDFSATTGGEVKDFSGTMTIHLPPGQSLVKIPLP